MQSTEYVDALPLLEKALAELSKGQLVRDERYGMMDLMSAIEVLLLRPLRLSRFIDALVTRRSMTPGQTPSFTRRRSDKPDPPTFRPSTRLSI